MLVFLRRVFLNIHRRNRRLASLLVMLMAMGVIFNFFSASKTSAESSAVKKRNLNEVICQGASSDERRQLFPMLDITSKILAKLKIVHFLCYKSLWAAAIEAGPFPWDRNAHLCALNSRGMSNDEPNLLRHFRRAGLDLYYSSADADYKITNSSLKEKAPYVMVTLFEEDPRLGEGMYRRVGWKRRLLPPNCDGYSILDCFPGTLVALPLPTKTFGPLTLPAPRDDIDMLKFHYPDTWYKPVEADC